MYSTREPMSAFHQRISFCLDIHNSFVKVGIGFCPDVQLFSCLVIGNSSTEVRITFRQFCAIVHRSRSMQQAL